MKMLNDGKSIRSDKSHYMSLFVILVERIINLNIQVFLLWKISLKNFKKIDVIEHWFFFQ